MLHELLFVLSGYPGDVFIPTPIDNHNNTTTTMTFAIATHMTPLLHPTERDSLNRLGHLGWIYAQLNQYITTTLSPSTTPLSIYHQAYATCLNTALSEYREVLLDMETRLVTKQDHAGDTVPISLIASHLARWQLFLPSMYRLTTKIQSTPAHKVLTTLIDQSSTGIPELHTTITTMMAHLHAVFYRQVTTWMMYGQLSVTYHDGFFITPTPTTTTNGNSNNNNAQSTATTTTTSQWHRHYQLDMDRFPSHLPPSMAESIFYVGKVVATLHINTHGRLVMPETMKRHHLDLLRTLQLNNNNDKTTTTATTATLTQHIHHAATIIHQIRHDTTSWLFSHVFQHQHTSSLLTYFGSFRQVFLLGDGDLWIQWLDLIQQQQHTTQPPLMMMMTPTTTTLPMTIQSPSQWTAMLAKASIGTPSEDQLDGYTFEQQQQQQQDNDDDDDTHNNNNNHPFLTHRLTYTLQWPVDLFLGDKEIGCYRKIWTLLMGLKRTHMALTRLLPSTKDQAVWRLRSHMLFWIDTLWSHMQVNVISRHYDQLVITCSNAQVDFDQVQTAHDTYLDELMRGCLLSLEEGGGKDTLGALLKTCLDFCDQVKQDKEEDQEEDWLTELELMFVHDSEYLFGLLSNQLQEIKLSGHLNELLMRLDYNKWYSTQRYQHVPDP